MAAPVSPVATRAQDPHLREQCSLQGLQSRLPLYWPCPADTPPSPKRGYRSHYTFLGWDELLDPANWEELSDFDWLLRLIDFSGLRPVLAQRLGWTSARGRRPYDPSAR